MHRLRHPTSRAALSVAALSAWLVLLFTGWVAGGAAHLLFAAALLLFPWRAALSTGAASTSEATDPEDERS